MSTVITFAQFLQGTVGDETIISDGTPQVAFIGRSNVGKSSTLNSLAGRNNLVKVGRTPGKTKEINFFTINFSTGKKCYFVDLPGYGYAKVSKTEREKLADMIRLYITHANANIKLVVLILDAKVGLTDFDRQVIEYLKAHKRSYLLAVNKIDKLNQKERHTLNLLIKSESGDTVQHVFYSAASGKHSNVLLERIEEYL